MIAAGFWVQHARKREQSFATLRAWVAVFTILGVISFATHSQANERYRDESAHTGKNPRLKPAPIAHPGTDPLLSKAWHLNSMECPAAWQLSRGRNTVIALIDSGIDYNHPDLAANVYRKHSELPPNGRDTDGNGKIDDAIGWDWIKGAGLPFDRSGHGTFLASLVAAVANNSMGSVGICPECKIMSLRFLNYEGMGDTEDAIEAIYYAIEERADIINLSFAGEGLDGELEKAIAKAGQANIPVFVSAGNDAENLDRSNTYPAKYRMPHLVTVASTTPEKELSERSNWSEKYTSVGAPGSEMLGIWFNEWADDGEGTSNASAVAAAVAGLIKGANRNLSAADVKSILMATVDPSPTLQNKVQSGGVINARKAVSCAADPRLSCLKNPSLQQ